MLAKEIQMMKKFNETRFNEIKTQISTTRLEQLKEHEKLLCIHESNIKNETSFLLSQSKEVNKSAKKYLETINDLGASILERAKETQYSREMKPVIDLFENKYNDAQIKLKARYWKSTFSGKKSTIFNKIRKIFKKVFKNKKNFEKLKKFWKIRKFWVPKIWEQVKTETHASL